MSDDWVLIRTNVVQLEGEQKQWALDLVRRLGHDPKDLRPELCVSTGPEGLRLHLSRYLRDGSGAQVPDHNLNVMATTPVVVVLELTDLPPELRPATVEA